MSRALVTGGAGFLGSHIADALQDAGYDVTIFDRRPSPWRRDGQAEVVGDLLDADAIGAAVAGQDVVFHLAALADLNAAKTRPMDTVQLNILGTVGILEAMRALGADAPRLMFASTVYVYSREGGFYRCSKQACESYIEEYRRRFGVRFTVLRYGSLYGPRADETNGVYRLLRSAVEGEKIKYGGSEEDMREYIHVQDAARLSVRACDDDYADKHLVLTGTTPLRARDLFMMFGEMLGRKVDVDYATAPGEIADGHYAVTPYAYTPKVGLKMTSPVYVDMGQGLLQVIEQVHAESPEDAG